MPHSTPNRSSTLAWALLALACVCASAEAATGARVLSSDDAGVTLEFRYDFPGFDSLTIDGRQYLQVKADPLGATATWGEPGDIALPVVPVMVGIPEGSAPRVSVLSAEREAFAWPSPLPIATPVGLPNGMGGAVTPATPARFPSHAPAELGAPAGLRDLSVVPVRFFPVAVDASGSGTLVRRAVVRVEFGRSSRSINSIGGGLHRPDRLDGIYDATVVNGRQARAFLHASAPPPVPRAFGSALNPEWKITVTTSGLLRVTADALSAKGFPAGVSVTQIALSIRDVTEPSLTGIETPIPIDLRDANANGVFDSGDDILFYAEDLTSRYGVKDARQNLTTTNVYWLTWRSEGGARVPSVDGWPAMSAPAVPASFTDSVHAEVNGWMRSKNLSSDVGQESRDQYLWYDTNDLRATLDTSMPIGPHPDVGTASLRAVFQGAAASDVTHYIALRTQKGGGAASDTTSIPVPAFMGIQLQTVTGPIPADMLGSGALGVHYSSYIQDGAGNVIPFSFAPVDYFDLTYPRLYVATNNALRFRDGDARGDVEFRVTGFTDTALVVLDVTSPRAPARLSLAQRAEQIIGGEMRVRAAVGGPRTFVAAVRSAIPAAGAAQIIPDTPSDWVSQAGAIDYLAIAPDSFVTTLQPLTDMRAAQGYRVGVARLEDVFDEFSGGVRSEWAIRRCLAAIRPAYAVLVGDGNEDQLEANPLSQRDVMPVHLILTFGELVAADNWFAALDSLGRPGVDATPDIALGRLPASTVAELSTVVDKTVVYEGRVSSAPWREKLLLVADDQWSTDYTFGTDYVPRGWEFAFEQAHNTVCAQLDQDSLLTRPTCELFYLADSTDGYRAVYEAQYGMSPQVTPMITWVQAHVKPVFFDKVLSDTTATGNIVYYQGHANRWVLTHEQLLYDFGIPTVCAGYGNANVACNEKNFGFPNIFFGFACHMSEFQRQGELNPNIGDALGEKMVTAPGAAAVATYASTAFEFAQPNLDLEVAINRALILNPPRASANEPHIVLGSWLVVGGAAYAAGKFGETARAPLRYVILGDPALRLATAPPTLTATLDGMPVVDGQRIRSNGTDGSLVVRVETEAGVDSSAITLREEPGGMLPLTLVSRDAPDVRDRVWEVSAAVPIRLGEYAVVLSAPDRAGRVGTLSLRVASQVTAVVDGSPYHSGNRFVSATPVVRFSVEPPVPVTADSFHVELDGLLIPATVTSQGDSLWLVDVDFAARPLANGEHTLTLRFSTFSYPVGLEVASRLFLTGLYAYPNPFIGRTGIQYTLSQPAQAVRIRVYTIAGRRVCEMTGTGAAGLNVVPWDGRDDGGTQVSNGLYVYHVLATGLDGARVEALGKLARAQ